MELAGPRMLVLEGGEHATITINLVMILEYRAGDVSRSFAALARRHGVKGGKKTVQRWYQQWNGSAGSLQRKAGTGKRPLLSTEQVKRHIATPIRHANRAHRSISYASLLPQVQWKKGFLALVNVEHSFFHRNSNLIQCILLVL